MNKFEVMNKVMVSDLHPEDKCLLVELILRSDEQGLSWPSVERLCKARGIKYTKNFKGADYYLPGLVTKVKKGRKNAYVLNTPALEGLSQLVVENKRTDNPAQEGVFNTPAVEGVSTDTPAVEGVYTPAVADNTPSVEGANSSKNNTSDSSKEALVLVDTRTAPSASSKFEVREESVEVEWELSLNGQTQAAASKDSTTENTPAVEGVLSSEGDTTMNHLICMPVKEREQLEKLAGIYGATEEQVLEAAALLRTTMLPGWDAREKHEAALKKVGVEIDEW